MMIQAAVLLPIAPLILLPFILVFFIAVFPVWLVAAIVTWLFKTLIRTIGGGPGGSWSVAADRWFRWVITFGGFTETFKDKPPKDA